MAQKDWLRERLVAHSDGTCGPVNSARYGLPRPRRRRLYVDGERAASDVVAVLCSAAGYDPYDRDLSDLVGELSTQSAEFRTRWAAHNVRFHDTGTKDLLHPVVGDITLTYNRRELAADPGQMLMIWTAEPGTRSRRRSAFSEAGPRRPTSRRARNHQAIFKSPGAWSAGARKSDRRLPDPTVSRRERLPRHMLYRCERG